jgi:hypothetical protein
MDRATLVNQIKAIIPEEDVPKFKSMLETSPTSEIRNLYNSYARMYNLTADTKLPIDNETGDGTVVDYGPGYSDDHMQVVYDKHEPDKMKAFIDVLDNMDGEDDGIIGGTITVSEEESSPSIVGKRLASFLSGAMPIVPVKASTDEEFEAYIQHKADADLMNYASEQARKNRGEKK